MADFIVHSLEMLRPIKQQAGRFVVVVGVECSCGQDVAAFERDMPRDALPEYYPGLQDYDAMACPECGRVGVLDAVPESATLVAQWPLAERLHPRALAQLRVLVQHG